MVASWLEPTVEMVKTPTVEVVWAMVAGRGCQTSTGATPLLEHAWSGYHQG